MYDTMALARTGGLFEAEEQRREFEKVHPVYDAGRLHAQQPEPAAAPFFSSRVVTGI
ncbi:MAG: hypothetical protein ACOX8O_05235 [Christensenellales bacterium]